MTVTIDVYISTGHGREDYIVGLEFKNVEDLLDFLARKKFFGRQFYFDNYNFPNPLIRIRDKDVKYI